MSLAAFLEGYGGTPVTDAGLATMTSVVLLSEAEPDPGQAKRAGEITAISVAITGRRNQLHDQADQQIRALAAVLAAATTSEQLAAVMSPTGTLAVNRAAVLTELQRIANQIDGFPSRWRQVLADAKTAATAEGKATASHAVAVLLGEKPGKLAATLPDHVGQALGSPGGLGWLGVDEEMATEMGGLAGDLAMAYGRKAAEPPIPVAPDGLTIPPADPAEPLDLTSVLADGDGSAYYLDLAVSQMYAAGQVDAYNDAGLTTLDWVSVGDGRVDDICISNEIASPYPTDALPDLPAHGGCRCWWLPGGSIS